MSQHQRQPQTKAASLPDPKAAMQNLFDDVHQRVFFHVLAGRGYAPQNEKQAAAMLGLGAKLRLVAEEQAVKAAADADDPFLAASAALDNVLGRAGLHAVGHAQHQEEQLAIKQAAWEWAQIPDIYNSVLALKAHEADQILAANNGQG